ISHNLAYVRPTDVSVGFTTTISHALADKHSINILCVPWPESVCPNDFYPVEDGKQSVTERFGFFSYAGVTPKIGARRRKMSAIVNKAAELVGTVDGVLLPELALAPAEFESISLLIQKKHPNAFVIAGVGTTSRKKRN